MIKAQCTGFLNTPPLWKELQFDIQQFEFPSIELQTFHPTPLQKNLRLGHQMEYVFKELIEHSKSYEILLYNLPIQNEERTMGEIDFVIKDKTRDKLIHVELTYKFYLIDPDIPDPIHSLIGPNRNDLFFTKMEKIKNKQFQLLHSPAGSKALADHNIDHLEIEHQCCFKAQLFLPFGRKTIDLGVLNEDCLAGYWLRMDEFNKADFANAQFYMPSKSEWVIQPNDQVVWKSHNEILSDIEQILSKEKSPMIWLRKLGSKIEKLFVVWW